MPFPDGTGMADETFTATHARNAAELQGGSIPQHTHGGGIAPPTEAVAVEDPTGMPTFGRPASAVDPFAQNQPMPPHMSEPGESFVPAPAEMHDDHGQGVVLAGLQADGQVNLAAGVGQPVDHAGGGWTNRPETGSLHLSGVAAPAVEEDNVYTAVVEVDLAGDDMKIKCPKCDALNRVKASGHGDSKQKCAKCSHDLSGAIKAKMAQVKKAKEGNLSAEEQEDVENVHLAVIFQQHPGMDLAVEKEPGGLVQKVICVTGTLALSPGPGQMDVDKPLQLTPDMFMSIKQGFDEQAFPHVTVPETHANGALENTGYVRQLEVKNVRDPSLPEDIKLAYKDWPDETQLMLAGIEFTEPEVRAKALNGSIPDTSVGVKFNYRNKRTGKTYPAALEHCALTPVPWVDGLTPFGNTLLSQQPFDQDEVGTEANFDGVFIDAPTAAPASSDADTTGDILSSEDGDGSLPNTVSPPRDDTGETMTTVEELLAQQQARAEAQEAEIARLRDQLQTAGVTLSQTAVEIGTSRVKDEIRALNGKVPPEFLQRVEAVKLAAVRHQATGSDDSLQLSVKSTDEAGAEVENKIDLSTVTNVVDFLVEGLPAAPAESEVTRMMKLSENLDASAASRQSAEQQAKQSVDEWEKNAHPERFDDNGNRKSATAA